MAVEAEESAPAPAVKKSGIGGILVNAVGIFVLTLAAVVAGGFVNAMLHPAQELILDEEGRLTLKPEPVAAEKGGKPSVSGPAIYFAMEPPLVVNFEQNGSVRFLQVTIEVMARDPAVIEAVQRNAPLIRNNLMLLMSNLTGDDVMTRDGKEKLRATSLAEVEAIIKRETGSGGVESLLFTSFVVQ